MSRVPRLRTGPGVNVTLQRGARTLLDMMDNRIAMANGPRLVQVTRGCDGQPTQHLLSDLQCDDNGAGTIQIATPTWNGVTERQFSGTAGRQPIIGTSAAAVVECDPTAAERDLARRYQDSVGNWWDYAGNWISAGHGTPALTASYHYTMNAAAEIPTSRIIRDVPSSLTYNIVFESYPPSLRMGGQMQGRSFSYAVRDYALRGICSDATCGRIPSTDYVFCMEWRTPAADVADPDLRQVSGPWVTIRNATTLALITDKVVEAPFQGSYDDGTLGNDWCVDVWTDGTFTVHQVVKSAGGTVVTDLLRYAYIGTTIAFLGYTRISNNGSGGKSAATVGTYFKQVA